VIVRERGNDWQVVLQIDHEDLSGAFARAWADRGRRHGSLAIAAARHDDGWAVWERAPAVEPETGKPVNFLDVGISSHLAFYRACIAAVTEQDPYAGLLVSMHGAGIYQRRYGRDPGLSVTQAEANKPLVDAFVDEQESGYPERVAQAGADEEERWRDYELLQLYDRLSLYFCMRDVEGGEDAELQGFRLEPIAPWHIRMQPFPFGEQPATFSLVRRVLPKDDKAEVLAVPPETVDIVVEP
jgi:Protein of unknown function (DUF3891)